MESELSENPRSILEDFEKLVDVKALLKVGLFRLRPQANESELLEKMKDILHLQMLVSRHEVYLVIFLKYNDNSKEITVSGYDLDLKGTGHKEVYRNSYPFPKS